MIRHENTGEKDLHCTQVIMHTKQVTLGNGYFLLIFKYLSCLIIGKIDT